jgi:cobalt-precorrin 5A hydrolase
MAALVLSQEGLALARRLRAAAPETTSIFGPSCIVGVCGGPPAGPEVEPEPGAAIHESDPSTFATAEPGVSGWTGPLRRIFPELWGRFDAIVAVMPVAIVVRLAGPLAGDKRREPAIVVVDEAGQFAVSVLGGHASGVDDLAERVAAILGAAPVVTTRTSSARSPRHVRGG